MSIFVEGQSHVVEADSLAYFRDAAYARFGSYVAYKYVEQDNSWLLFTQLSPANTLRYELAKGSPEEAVFLAEKEQVDAYDLRDRVELIEVPAPHAASHQHGGADEIDVTGLSGELADAQTPKAHSLAGVEHQDTTLAALNAKISDATLDDQANSRPPVTHGLGSGYHSQATLAELNALVSDAVLDDVSGSRTPVAHRASHEVGGADALNHQNITGSGTKTHAQLDAHVVSSANPHSVTKTQVGLGNVTDDAQLKRAANDFATFAEKINPDGADLLLIEDSAAAGAKKKIQVGNLPSSPSSVEVLESRITYQISTTSTSWVSIKGLAVTFTPKAGEVVLVNFIGSLGSSGYCGERVKLDVQHNNSGSYQRIGDRGRGLQYIESYVQLQEFPSAFSIAVALPNAVETTIVPVWRVDGAAGYLFGDYSALIFQVVRF